MSLDSPDTSRPTLSFDEEYPAVSYVMPVLNEERYLADAVAAVRSQDYPGKVELILALGPSTDRTTSIAEKIAVADHHIRLVHNPGRDIPKGLNLAIKASSHPVVIRVDAHSELPDDYTAVAVSTLRRTGAANVGGLMLAKGRAPFQRAVAQAYNSPFGLGGGTYHHGTKEGPCESAYMGCFRREVLLEVGMYDECVRRGEDWELNLRIREAGHLVWFTPDLRVTYWPRDSRTKLARQFYSTGVWRGDMMRDLAVTRKTPPRFFAPGALVTSLAASSGLGVLEASTKIGTGKVLPRRLRWLRLAHLGPVAYALFLAAVFARTPGTARERWNLVSAIATMHVAWGSGFMAGVLRGGGSTVDTSRHR